MKRPVIRRLLHSFILAPAIFLLLVYIMVFSDSPLISTLGIPRLLLYAAGFALAMAYCVTMFLSAIRKDDTD